MIDKMIEAMHDKVIECVRGGWSIKEISNAIGMDEERVRALANLGKYKIPPDFVLPDNAPRKTIHDLPDEYWNMDVIEQYNETPYGERIGGNIPVYHNLAMADPFHCPTCRKTTMFTYNDTSVKKVYLMQCGVCGYEFTHDCR